MARPKNTRDPIVQRVLDASSNATVLAGRLGIRPSAVSQWKVIPLKRVPEVARITGIPEHELRPDVAELFARRTTPNAAPATGTAGRQTVVRFKRRPTAGPAWALIERLGGYRKVAEVAGVAPIVACKWHSRGIPHKYWPALQAAGVTLAELEACRPKRAADEAA